MRHCKQKYYVRESFVFTCSLMVEMILYGECVQAESSCVLTGSACRCYMFVGQKGNTS